MEKNERVQKSKEGMSIERLRNGRKVLEVGAQSCG